MKVRKHKRHKIDYLFCREYPFKSVGIFPNTDIDIAQLKMDRIGSIKNMTELLNSMSR